MAERKPRRYSHRSKVTAVIAAEMTSLQAAADAQGIPPTTLAYWMDQPEFVTLRTKTREDMAEESRTLAHRTLGEIARRLPDFEPRDLTVLYGVLVDKGQLLSGGATSRAEHRDITDQWDDHEREALAKVLRDAVEEAVDAGG